MKPLFKIPQVAKNENVEIFRDNSENKLWDANHQPWNVINSIFSQCTREPPSGQAWFNQLIYFFFS